MPEEEHTIHDTLKDLEAWVVLLELIAFDLREESRDIDANSLDELKVFLAEMHDLFT